MRALVIGLGRMGSFHAKVLADLGYDVTTVDPDPARRATYPAPPLGHYPIVAIATPIHLLARTMRAVMRHHPTYLLVEKPFAASATEAAAVIPVLHGVPHVPHVAVGYTERFNPQVRRLLNAVRANPGIERVTFTRHNDRPSSNPGLDLAAHDIDIEYLIREIAEPTERYPVEYAYDTRASQPAKRRAITVEHCDGTTTSVDLTAHTSSPLHAMWHAFLSDRDGYATPTDAFHVLQTIEREHATPALAA